MLMEQSFSTYYLIFSFAFFLFLFLSSSLSLSLPLCLDKTISADGLLVEK